MKRWLVAWAAAGVPLSIAVVVFAVMKLAGPRLDNATGMATTVFLGFIILSGSAACYMLLRDGGPWRLAAALGYFAAMYFVGGFILIAIACSFGPCH